MDKKILIILKSEIHSQLDEIEKIYTKLQEREKVNDKFLIEAIAYQLHNLYCAYEDLFKIIARTFENNITDEAKFHIELLKRMAISIEGVRPGLISEESFKLLDTLRSFRHFFRHAYSYELDERKIKIVLEDAYKLKEIFKKDLEKFFSMFEM
ncbi:MAG: hypothetical protein BWY23_02591 [Spirochaetes bacterium ADurb.Bin218]|jgi:uncharacterized protein YutE (UPF0331/DUF86 family)|nr:hypothetical protein [Elusimicrobiales bacterium]OQA94960.1 MAG: hypothetical protein BWY23_02591 [Spirochaetes bacterium ADurb.Bin218]